MGKTLAARCSGRASDGVGGLRGFFGKAHIKMEGIRAG